MRKKKSHRAIYGLLGTVVAVTAIGNVAAKETKPYKAPELRLVKGTEDYDLTEGITYDKGKYELMVEDTGDFDIEVLGKYTVEYSLTPLDEEDERYSGADNASKNEDPELDSAFQVGPEADKEETSSDSQAGSTKAVGEESEASDGSAAKAESTEASHYNKEDKKEASAAADLEAGKIGIAKAEKKGGFFTRLFARLSGFVHAAELDETRAYALETDDSAKDKAETGKADREEAGKAETSASETKESEAGKAETKESEAGEAETRESETGAAESSKEETREPETSAAETKESATATSSNADGTLDEDDGIIYFDRIVRVVASDTGSNIEFDDPRLEIPSSAELFGIQIHGEFPVATDSNATPAEEDAKATNSNASKPTSDKEADETLDEGFWVNENETDTENEAFSEDSDGATESGIEYSLVLKKPELLLEDAYFTDPDGKKQKKVEIKVKNAEELKDAVLVEEDEKGVPVITGMELGTYTIELSAVDPDIEEEITCEREVEVVPGQRVKFDAPTLYIGTRNTSYDLTSGMVARDENGTEVTALYVVDETELLAAKEEVATASNTNAETAAGQQEGEETQEEGAAGNGLKKGIYHAVIGAKHPVTGEEFTVSRKVEVIDGCYIYAPVLEIRAGSTDYDLTSGAEIRDASGTEEKTVDGVAITIEDVSDLYRGIETGEENEEEEAEEETTAGEKNTADGIAAAQTDTAAHYAMSAYALSLASEDTAESETGTETGTETADQTEAADTAEAAAETETTGEFKTEKPALQEGTYMVTLSAVDSNTGEKIYVTRQVRVAARTAGLFSYKALNGTLSGTTSTVALLPGQVTSWNDFLPDTGRTGNLRDGAAADVVLTATDNTNEADLLFGGYDNVQGLDQYASISIDGSNHVFAKDKLKQPTTYSDAGRKFDITIPAMQVEMKNFVFDGLTGYPAYGTAAAIESQSSKIRMSEGSYLRLDNNKLELSSDFDAWSEANRAKYNGSRYGESVANSDFWNRVSTTHMMILPVTGAEQKYDLSVVQGSTYSPRYLIKSPRNIVVDAATGVQSSPLAANNIGGNATVKLGNGGIAELYYLRGAQKTTVEGTGTIKFRTYYDALDRNTDFQDGISTQVLEVQDNVIFAKGVFGNSGDKQPIIRITGDNGKIKVQKGKKITVARVANPTTPSEHDGGLTKVINGDVIATAEKTGVLNPLDFTIWGQTLPDIDSKDKYLYLEFDSTRKELKAVERDPVWKIHFPGEDHTAYTLEQALDYLKNKTGGVTLTNSTDYTMTEEDIRALEQFSNTNVSINIVAGFKTEKTWDHVWGNAGSVGIVHGDYSYRLYVSSFPNQELNLPKNVDVLFEDVVFQFITKQNGPITIVGNGGTTTFRGETNYFYDSDNTRMKPILYGGTKDGKETGLNESILCFQPIIYSVYYGMGNSELNYCDARTYDAEFTSIYNFDELKFIEGPVGGNGLAGNGEEYGGTVTVSRELDAQKDGVLTKDGGYKGRITLGTYRAELVLTGRDAIHRAGSLQGNVKNRGNSGQIEIRGGAAEYPDGAGGMVTRSNVKNQYILTLTDEDPLCYEENRNLPDMGLKIKRHENSANGEIAVYLPNVPDEKAQKYITTKWMNNYYWDFKAPFHSIKEDANGEKIKDYTIRWIGSGIYHYINVNTGWEANFITLEELLETMKLDEKTRPGGEYIISAYVLVDSGDQRFIMSAEDAEALKKAVTTITTPKKITWTSAYDVNGDRIESMSRRNTLTLKSDFHFFGQESVVKEMNLRFDGNWNMYANGKPLTFDRELDINSYKANRANIFGGNEDGQGITNTHLTFNTDTEIFANIYGGSASGTCAADAVIDFKDGYGYAVYGGNKEGSHTGKTSITIARKPDARYNEILLVNGGSEKEQPDQKKPKGKTVDIITRGNLKVKNLYNYDSLTVETGSLTIPNSDKAGEYNINAAFTEGYAGKTVLCDETTMQLLNYKGTRKMGSLTRAAQADLADEAKQPKLVMKKADKDDAGHTASSKENKYLLELTALDPFDMANFETNRKIKVSYDDAKSEVAGDVLFNLSGAAKAEQAAAKPGIASLFRSLFRAKAANTGKTYYVTTKAINWQHNITPIANENEKTIALPEPHVLLLDKAEAVIGSYPDVAGAIVNIAAKEQQNGKVGDTYTIAVFTTDYTFTEADRLAAAYAAGKYTGDFDYNEEVHDLSTISNANIIWSGQYINDKANKTTDINQFRVVNPNGNLDFFGATTLVNNIKFNYDKNAATGRDLYANGSTITIGKEFRYKAGSAYANLYGGSKTTQSDGATTRAGAQTDKIIKLEPRNANDDAFYFQDIKDFTKLYVGNSGQTGGVRVKLMVTGKMDSDPDKAEGQKTGTVTLQNGWLRFTGTDEKASAEIGNLVGNGHTSNAITVVGEGTTADTRNTYYLKISGKTTNEVASKKIYIDIRTYNTDTQYALVNDVVVEYSDRANADENCYYSGYASLPYVRQERARLRLTNSQKPLERIHLYKNDVKEGGYYSYADALQAIDKGDETVAYTLRNVVDVEFTANDQKQLDEFAKIGKAKTLTFEAGPYNASYGGTADYNYYRVTSQIASIKLPANRSYPVTWNAPIYYAAGNVEFINNGGELTFGENFVTPNRAHAPYDVVVYGGAESGTCTQNVVLNIQAGQFKAIYGGNKAGDHTGNATININCPTDKMAIDVNNYLRIESMDGASNGENQKPKGKTVTVNVENEVKPDKTGPVTIKNLYNWDELHVKKGTLQSIDGGGENASNYNAHKANGYTGKTIIYDNATLKLLGYASTRKMGSIERQADANYTTKANLVLYRTWPGKGNYDAPASPYHVELTSAHPFGENYNGSKISVSYRDTIEGENDVIFKLTGIGSGGTLDKTQLTVKPLESRFANMALVPEEVGGVPIIRLKTAYVALLAPDKNNMTKYIDMAGAIVAIAEKENLAETNKNAAGEYNVSFFRYAQGVGQVYKTTNLDIDAMKLAAGKKAKVRDAATGAETEQETETLTYLNETYNMLAKADNAVKITWGGNNAWNGDPVQYWSQWQPTGELNFFGAETVLNSVRFQYDETAGKDATMSRDIYANGSNLTFGLRTYMDNTKVYPNLYGGSSNTAGAGNTSITDNASGKNITFQNHVSFTTVKFQDLKDFSKLTIGNHGVSGLVHLYVLGQLDSDLVDDAVAATESSTEETGVAAFFKNAVESVQNLLGVQTADADANANAAVTTAKRKGTVYLDHAYLVLHENDNYGLDYKSSYVGTLEGAAGVDNYLVIPKDSRNNKNLTYPLVVTDNMTAPSDRGIVIRTTPGAKADNDIAVVYADPNKPADKTKFRVEDNFRVESYKNRIILKNTNAPIGKIRLWRNDVSDKVKDDHGQDTTEELLYATYKDAFEAIGAGDASVTYKFENLAEAEFTDADAKALLTDRKAKAFEFVGGPYVAAYGGTNYDGYYGVNARTTSVTMPWGYPVTWNLAVKYEMQAEQKNLEFFGNGGNLTFDEKFRSYTTSNTDYDFIVYGGAEISDCSRDANITVKAGQFKEIYGGNKHGKHTGKVNITVDRPADIKAIDANYLRIERLDGSGAYTSNNKNLENKHIGDRMKYLSYLSLAGNKQVTTDDTRIPQEYRGTWDNFPKAEKTAGETTITVKTHKEDPKSTTAGKVSITQLFNYDTLNVEDTTLTIPNKNVWNGYGADLASSLILDENGKDRYKGKTVIADGAELKLENCWGYRRMGQLVRAAGAQASQKAKLFFNFVGDYNTYKITSADHPFAIQLTGDDAFGLKQGMEGKRITVSANTKGDRYVVFKLQKQSDVSIKTLENDPSSLSDYTMIPGTDDKSQQPDQTIRLTTGKVLVMETGNKDSRKLYPDIAQAIVAIADKEAKASNGKDLNTYVGGDYLVSFLRQGDYKTSDEDLDAMKLAAGKKVKITTPDGPETESEDLAYRGDTYTGLAKAGLASKITWGARADINGNPMTVHWVSLKPTGELNFFGKNTTLAGLRFAYDDNVKLNPTQSRDIYANGSNVSFENYTLVDGTNYPSLYGGASAQTDGKAEFGTITFRNNAAHILKFQDIKGFKLLTVGNNGANGITGEGAIGQSIVEVYGALKNEAPNGGVDILKASSSTAVQTAAEGDGTDPAPVTKPDGSVHLKQGHLKLLGAAEPVITSMYADATGENQITIPKKGSKTYPLKIAKETVLEKAENPIVIATSVTESIGDVLAEYPDASKAVAEQYKTKSAYTLTKAENKLVLEKKGSYYVKTSKGEEGIISELNSGNYDKLITNTQGGWHYLYDHMDGQYKANQMNPANDRTGEADHMLQYFKQGEKIEGKTQTTSDRQQTYDVYKWETAKTFLPAFAGQWDSFEWGSVEGGLSNQQLTDYWNGRSNPAKPADFNNSYYYDSNRLVENNVIVGTKGGTKATWQGFGNGKGLYDWKTQEWLDEPTVTVRDLTKPYFEYPHNLTGHVVAFGSTISGWNEKESSLVIDFDSKGKNNTADFSHIGWCTLQAQGTYPGFPDYGQLSIKNVSIGNGLWAGGVSGKYFNLYSDNKVIRLDGWVGNGGGWYFDERNGYISQSNVVGIYGGQPHSVIQIKLSDVTTQSPAYEIGSSVGRVMVKAGKMIPDVDMVIYGVRDSVQIDTGDGGVVKLLTITPGTDKATLEFKGTGMISMTKFAGYGSWKGWSTPYMWGGQTYGHIAAQANILHLMNDGVTFLSGNGGWGTNLRINHVDSDGHRLNAGASDCYVDANNYSSRPYKPAALTENYSFAEALKSYTEVGMLDATDFRLKLEVKENSATKVLNKPGLNGLYLTQDMNGDKSRIMVKKFIKPDQPTELLEHPLQLKKDDAVIDYYDSYKEAFDQMNDENANYTITNLVEWNLEPEDVEALAALDNTKAASITFEGGERPKGKTDGKAGSHYRLRLRKQTLTMPENVDIAFRNIALKYDQGINKELTHENEVIIGNGGELTFDNVVFLKHGDEDMAPIVYGGSENGKQTQSFLANLFTRAAKPSNINVRGGSYNFTSVYNYDEMNIGRVAEDATTTETTVTVLDTLDAQKGDGYKGVTQISSKGTLILPNADDTKLNKRIGSLKGLSTMTAGENATGALKLARPNLGEAVKFNNNAVLNLTAKDPLASDDTLNKIQVSYTDDSGKPVNNDVVMYLRNVEENSKAEKVHCRYLTDGFGGVDAYGAEIAMSANPADKTIILRNGMVALSTDNGANYTQYARLAQALEALKTHAEANSKGENADYILTIFVDGYTVDAADEAKMKELRDSTTINPKSIIWTSGIDGTGANAAAPANVILSADMNLFGQANAMRDVILNAAEKRSIFANGSKLTITGTAKGTEHIDVYGGADGKDLTANTTLDVTGQSFGNIYGGSRNGTVTGTTTVTITLPPATTKAAAAFKLKNVSGDGVGVDGDLAESATGKKTITIAPQTGLNEYQITMDNLTGFDVLNLGNGDVAENYDYSKQVFQVTGRFDSKTVDTAGNTGRTGVVNVNRATLILAGESGHIGQLKANGITGLRVNKIAADTKPLIVDQDITFTQSTDQNGGTTNDRMLLGFINDQKAAGGDVVIRYTDKTQADVITDANLFYADGTGSNLALLKEVNGNAADIKFYVPPAHQMKVHVAYDSKDSSSKASDASDAFTTGVNKHIIVDYNPENEHPVKGGYLVRIPKGKVEKPEETDYTNVHLDGTEAYTGTYNGTLPVATKDGQKTDDKGNEIAIYPMTAATTGDRNGATLRTTWTVPIDTANYFYVAHVMCTGDESSAVLADVTGAKQDQTAAKDITVDYDADKQVYTVSGSFIDPVDTKNAAGKDETLPYAPNKNGRLTYARAGITEYAWAFGDGNGNADADAAAVAHTGDDPAKAAISLKQGAADQKFLGATEVDANGATYAKVSIPLTKTAVDEQKTAGKTYFYLYFKDGANNTSRYAVPIDEHTIDVTVPTRVSLVAVKKPTSNGSSADSKLLAPTCYVVNHGNNTIKVQIEKFAKSADNRNNSLNLIDTPYSNHDYNYTGNELALYLKATEGDGKPLASNAADTVSSTMFNLRNVLSINQNDNGEYAYLGDLKPKNNNGRTLDFTFTARYNPKDIEETNDWLTNIMSYRFSVVPKDTTRSGNQDETGTTQNAANGSQSGADNGQAGADGTQDETEADQP